MNSEKKLSPYDVALLTPAEMGVADREAMASGVSGPVLMEAAGRAVADAVQARWSKRPVAVLCGPGNNGGDGFTAARHLAAAGWPVRLTLLGARDHLVGDAAYHAALWQGEIEPFSPSFLEGAGVVVDAIFGAGLSRPIEGAAAEMIEALKQRKTPTCAIDVPSGLDGGTGEIRGTAAPADVTVTFFRKKPGHLLFPGRRFCGALVLADIGTPEKVLSDIKPKTFENGPALWLDGYPWPATEGHKYRRGHALVLGGETITGAARLTALGALRVGAGLVTLAAPAPSWPVYATALISVIVRSFNGIEGFNALLADQRKNAIAIGPGAGVGVTTKQLALAALATKRAVVLDADALTSFAQAPGSLFQAVLGPCVLTPHEGEFVRLFEVGGNKLARARHAAKRSNAVVLLKGPDTVIAAPDGRAAINVNAPPELATGGTGDVLTGLVAGLLAQGMDAFNAAAAAAWLHGEAAKLIGLGLIAEDLPHVLPEVLQHLKDKSELPGLLPSEAAS
ncbi:MAG TPA: NAD(P)H-hydrate dehydratase [Bradyrhizobium sp.]|nr:NAD(P)H-hydrate dehydratase [Bradyrhizobium sp.]